ncbi:MAG: DUF1353 domain-containing protein [Sulfitobacter sp.]|nr:DUF1353 domain-containing protein [Sulfitobacter sp.]
MTATGSDWCEKRGSKWVTTRELAWGELTVPAGYPFEPSIPCWARWWLPPHDPRFLRAAALHDYAIHNLEWSRERAAVPFSEALREQGVEKTKRLAMVLAVIAHKWR